MNIAEIKRAFNVYAVKFDKRQQGPIEKMLDCPNIRSAGEWNNFLGISPQARHLELPCTVCPVRLIADLGKENGKSLLTLSSKGRCNPKSDFYGEDLSPDIRKGNHRVKKSGIGDDRTGAGLHPADETRGSRKVTRNPWTRNKFS